MPTTARIIRSIPPTFFAIPCILLSYLNNHLGHPVRLDVGDAGRSLTYFKPHRFQAIKGTINSATMLMILISGLTAGPAVSLYGSPTVSPVTAALCASEPLPPKVPSSMYFLALSQAPPPEVIEIATNIPEI